MTIFRQYIAPLLAMVIFLVALVAVSARIFLPTDMASPAPLEEVVQDKQANAPGAGAVAGLPPSLSALVKGLPDDIAFSEQL